MKPEKGIFEHGLEEYPRRTIIFGNVLMILWIALGTIACWLFYPLAAWIYLAFAIIMVGIVLRKMVCTNCYYFGKYCHLGWGKFSALLFKKGTVEEFEKSIGLKLAPPTYGLLSLIPIVLIIISIVQELTVFKISVLLLLLLVSFYSSTIGRKKACTACRMKLICPGCAAK